MQIKQIFSLLLINVMFATIALAHEPTNLSIVKQKLKHYHDSGAYMGDLANVTQKAMRYLDLRLERHDFHAKKPAIVLDIDETALSNYPAMLRLDFGGTYKEMWEDAYKGSDGAILPTLKLFRYAKEKNIAIFFITGRYEPEREVTVKNLAKVGFTDYDKLILRSDGYLKMSTSEYKSAVRKQLTDEGYLILLNVGDQLSDLRGGYADKAFKVPNPYYLLS